jgi:ATP-dependent Clp protease ATP-binding subunit ClpC
MLKLRSITNDWTQAARESRLAPALGREKETFAALQLLARKGRKSILVTGESGVGKTRFVQGLAVAGVRPSKGDNILGFTILELDLPAFLPTRQNAQEALGMLIEFLRKSPDVVLFIDDIHLVLLPDRGGENGSLAASMLVPAIKRGEIACIGALASNELEALKKIDPGFVGECEVIRLEPLTETATLEILEKITPALQTHHGVSIAPEARDAAVKLTVKCMPNVKLPGKAIEILDQACARYKLKLVAKDNHPELVDSMTLRNLGTKVGPHDVKRVIREITNIDIDKELAAEWQAKLAARLKKAVPGQDDAMEELAAAMSRTRLHFGDPKKVAGAWLLWGPPAIDKEQIAKALTYQLFGNHDNLLIYDMAKVVGANGVGEIFGQTPSRNESPLLATAEGSPFAILAFTAAAIRETSGAPGARVY